MMAFAWVVNGQIQRLQSFETAPEALPPAKGAWLPVELEDPESAAHTVPEWQIKEDVARRIWTIPAPDPVRLDQLVAEAISRVNAEFEQRANAPIVYAVDGFDYYWGGDATARENVMGVVTLISAGVPVDNPRPWTPHGSMTPVMVTHAELIGLGAAMAARKDALYVAKKDLVAAIMAAADSVELAAIDVSAGWP